MQLEFLVQYIHESIKQRKIVFSNLHLLREELFHPIKTIVIFVATNNRHMKANTIQEVIDILDNIIDSNKLNKNRLGYFAALYRRMTIGVQNGINQGVFQFPAKMEELDVVFANRYFDAYFDYKNKKPITTSWLVTLKAAERNNLTVMQHLLLGMNAHINLDLGISVADISNKHTVQSLRSDYLKINEIIAGNFVVMQNNLAKIALPMKYLLKQLNQSQTHAVLNFSMTKARDLAWSNALLLTEAGNKNLAQVVDTTDQVISRVANSILSPGTWLSFVVRSVLLIEQKDIARNIAALMED